MHHSEHNKDIEKHPFKQYTWERSWQAALAGDRLPQSSGHPERFAQETLGHSSKVVNRAYTNWASTKIPSMEEYEREAATSNA